MVCITPIFFVSICIKRNPQNTHAYVLQGISQCLITVRLALSTGQDTAVGDVAVSACSSNMSGSAQAGNHALGMTFKVPTTLETDSICESSVADSSTLEKDAGMRREADVAHTV